MVKLSLQPRPDAGIARPYPVTIERLAQWAASLDEKGIDLAPVSALIGDAAHQ